MAVNRWYFLSASCSASFYASRENFYNPLQAPSTAQLIGPIDVSVASSVSIQGGLFSANGIFPEGTLSVHGSNDSGRGWQTRTNAAQLNTQAVTRYVALPSASLVLSGGNAYPISGNFNLATVPTTGSFLIEVRDPTVRWMDFHFDRAGAAGNGSIEFQVHLVESKLKKSTS